MQTLRTYLLLLSATLLLTGFSWNFAADPCKEALDLATTLENSQDDAQMRQTEAKIITQCPDGAAARFVGARQFERVGNIDGAISEYRQALQRQPTFARASGNLGLLYARKGLNDEASVELERGLMAVADPRYHKALGRILASQKVYALATWHYTEAARSLTRDAELLSGLAEIYSATGQTDKALVEYRKATAIDPNTEKPYLGTAAIYLQRNEPEKALEQLKRAEQAAPANRDVHLMLAGIYEKKGDAKQADYHYLLGGSSKKSPVQARTAAKNSAPSGAGNEIELLKAVILEHPDDAASYTKLGHLYLAAGKESEAIDAYREAAHLNSTDSSVYLNLGNLHAKRSQLDEAVVAYKRAVKVNPANPEAHLRLGDIRFTRGLFQEAVDEYSEFLKLRPESPDIHLKLARIFTRSKEPGLAMASYMSVLKYSPNDADANREIAVLYAAKGDNEKAIEHYRKVLALHKDDNDARTALVSIYVKGKQYDEITTLLKEAVEIAPDDPLNHYKLGLLYDFKKEYDHAEASYKKAVELKPDHARSLNALGRLYMKTGRLEDAKLALEAAKKADPAMEEASILLNNIRDEFNPEPRKITKGKKGRLKKGHKSLKKSTKKTKANSRPGSKRSKTHKKAR